MGILRKRLAAWFGSLVNGPIADKFGRKMNMIIAVIIFVAGSSIQASAVSTGMLFVGRFSGTERLKVIH
jgi:MFS family permease